MIRIALVGAALMTIAGIVVVLTLDSLLGPILIVAGVGALGVAAIPSAVARIATWLSIGFRR